jgi:hypothetical protein
LNAQSGLIENSGLLPGCHLDSAQTENSPSQTSLLLSKINCLIYSSLT